MNKDNSEKEENEQRLKGKSENDNSEKGKLRRSIPKMKI